VARSKIFQSPDGRAEIHWRFGYIRDQLTLVVDGRVVEEVEVYGTEGSAKGQNILTTGVEYRLEGLGYHATVVMKSRHIFSSPEVVHCDIAADLRNEYHEKARSKVSEDDHTRDDGWTTASALKELGLQPEQNVWRLVREAHAGLVRRYHPDVYASSNLPEELIRAAAQRLQRINEAFGYLRSVSAAKSHEEVKPQQDWKPAVDEFGTPKQRIYWNGQQWLIWDANLRGWVAQTDVQTPSRTDDASEPKQRIRWDGLQWMIWDQRLRGWIPQVDR
jgi:hypothetical protein